MIFKIPIVLCYHPILPYLSFVTLRPTLRLTPYALRLTPYALRLELHVLLALILLER